MTFTEAVAEITGWKTQEKLGGCRVWVFGAEHYNTLFDHYDDGDNDPLERAQMALHDQWEYIRPPLPHRERCYRSRQQFNAKRAELGMPPL
jgi:hypothetical protein